MRFRSLAFQIAAPLAMALAACDSETPPTPITVVEAESDPTLSLTTRPIEAQPIDLSVEVEQVRRAGGLPSIAAAAFRGGRLVAFGASGYRKLGDETPITMEDEWHLGSCTKAMTATLVGMLVEDGKFAWDDTLAKLLPDMTIDPSLQSVTVEMLLQHRAGFEHDVPVFTWGALWDGAKEKEAPELTRERVLRGTLAIPAPRIVGTYNYSNVGYMIGGMLVDRYSGAPWEHTIRERLFAPLDMKSCGFGAPARLVGFVDQPYGHRIDRATLAPVTPGLAADIPASMAPAGSVHCSLADWAKFLGVHVRGERDEPTLLAGSSIKRMHRPLAEDPYASGWNVRAREWAGGMTLNHAGSNSLNFASTWLAPEKDLIFVVATNAAPLGVNATADAALAPMIERLSQ